LIVDAQTTGGRIFEFEGSLERRSVLSADGVRPGMTDAPTSDTTATTPT
jgi:hypothetical protein